MILQSLRAEGIGCRDYFTPIHLEPLYRESFGFSEGSYPIAESQSERTIALPYFSKLAQEEVEHVARVLGDLISKRR